jgi:O-succinylbenzoic acid--CoA ligase
VPQLVAIDLPGGPEFVDVFQQVWADGDAALPLDQRLSDSAKASVIDQLRPAWIVESGRQGPSRRRARHDGDPVEEGDALVVATSGTTGEAKGVVLTHAAVEASARATSARLGVVPARHRWLACLPLNHIGGLSVITRALVTSTPLTVLPGFDAATAVAHAGADTYVSLVATALRRVGAAHFHTVVLGGSAPPDGLAANVVTTYGLTETGSGIVYDGAPLDGVEVRVDPRTSEVEVRGPMLLRAYRDGRDPKDAHGWLATGDAGHLDADGRLHVHGRLAEMIITGGENVWPGPVEAALRRHAGVAEVAVAGCDDVEWGQRVVAWVVASDRSRPPRLDELRALVAERVAPYAAPRQLILVEKLPRTSIGKVRRDALPPA